MGQGSDKLWHFAAFFLFEPFVYHALSYLKAGSAPLRRRFASVGLAASVGGALELWQACLPHRSAEWADFFADAGGAVLAGVLGAIILWVLGRRA
jgi:VanZ family protein